MPNRIVTEIDGRQVALSNLDRLMYPEAGLVKAELIKYYLGMAPVMLPHLWDRPLVFTRFPDGIAAKGFYQKNAPPYLPEWIATHQFDDDKRYILAREKATLAWLANHSCIEIHPWLSRVTSLAFPDFLVFDLDPSPGNTLQEVIEAALEIRRLLQELKLTAYPKTSGGKGIHIYLPIKPKYTYEAVRELAIQVANILVSSLPDTTTQQRMKAKRGKRIYIDCLQIGEGKTLCAPYSLRPTPRATVSTPLRWEELADINPEEMTTAKVSTRVSELGDLFRPVLTEPQTLELALKAMLISNSR